MGRYGLADRRLLPIGRGLFVVLRRNPQFYWGYRKLIALNRGTEKLIPKWYNISCSTTNI
jgi:hypothetical protein